MALQSCLQVPCYAFAMTLATPFTGLYIGVYTTPSANAAVIVGGMMLWLCELYVLKGHLWIFMDKSDAGQLERDLFMEPGFDSVIIEQSLTFNRQVPNV
jgi:hypothetical protein